MDLICAQCAARYVVPKPGAYSCRKCGAVMHAQPPAAPPPAAPPPAAPPPVAQPPAPPPSVAAKSPAAAVSPQHAPTPPAEADLPKDGPGLKPGPEPPADRPSGPPLAPEVEAEAAKLEERIRENPKGRAIYIQLAQLYLNAKRKDLAIVALERYLQLDPDNPMIKNRLLALQGKLQAARIKPLAVSAGGDAIKQSQQKVMRMLGLGLAAVVGIVGLLLLYRTVFPSEIPIAVGTDSAQRPLWSPTGRHIAYVAAGDDGTSLCVYELGSKRTRELAKISGDRFAWSPSGLRLAYEGNDEDSDYGWGEAIYVVDAAGGEPRRVIAGSQPSWSGDGMFLAFRCTATSLGKPRDARSMAERWEDSDKLCVVNATTREARKVADLEVENYSFTSASGELAFEVHQRADYEDYEAAMEGAQAGGRDPVDMFEDALEAGGGDKLATDSSLAREIEKEEYANKGKKGVRLPQGQSNIHLVRPDGSGLRQLTHDNVSAAPRWSADGKRILYTFRAADGDQLWSMNKDGSDKQPLTSPSLRIADLEGVQLSPDGKRLVFRGLVEDVDMAIAVTMTGSAPVDLFVVDVGGREPERIENKHTFKQRFSLSPDGKQVAYEYRNSKTEIGEIWLTSP